MHTTTDRNRQHQVTELSLPNAASHIAALLTKVAEQRCRPSFSKLFHYYAPRVLAYGIRHFGNEQIAADLVQETMSNVWHKAHLFNPAKGLPDVWIFTIARNIRFDLLRRSRHQQDELSADDLWPVLSEQAGLLEESDRLDNHILLQQISQYYTQLPEQQREVLEQLYIEGKSQQEVSDTLGIPLGTIKSRTRLALIKLKELIA